jgi:hypothetical protein
MMKKYLIFIGLILLGFSCQSEDEGNTDESSPGIIPNSIEQIADVIELKYGEEKEWNYNGQVFKFTITDAENNLLPCAFMDFSGDTEGLNKVRMHVYLSIEMNNQLKQIKVSSKTCGVYEYKNDDTDIQELWDMLESWPVIEMGFSHFQSQFIWAFGEGTQIENTSFSIYMAKSYPTAYMPEYTKVEKNQYKFIFIITAN